jgi:hypothetical protein
MQPLIRANTSPAADTSDAPAVSRCCAVVELRQYSLHPGTRETLIELFDREFVESQEDVGICVIAQFRDIDRPDVFTWLRGFPDMPSRAASLTSFYDGPVWTAHKGVANPTMITFDNVRLLRPAPPGVGFALRNRVDGQARGLVVATIYTLRDDEAPTFSAFFLETVAPRVAAAGAAPLAAFETEPSENTWPRLPVRLGEHAFVWFTSFDDVSAYDRHVAGLGDDPTWTRAVAPELQRRLTTAPEIWRLVPTARSRDVRYAAERRVTPRREPV